MPDPLFASTDIAASAMSAERLRMTVASENLAHAGDTRPLANGLPYERQRVVFSTVLDQAGKNTGAVDAATVAMPRYSQRHDPSHPHADPVTGLVTEADIDPILELTDLMVASRAYDANANAARGLLRMHESALRIAES
jgi:flagellar basal-body rod protein FlgC